MGEGTIRLVTVFLVGFWISALGGQTTVTGSIRDKGSQASLIGANVLVSGGRLSVDTGAASDLEGRYSIPPLRPGRYTLRVLFIGYATLEMPLIIEASTGAIINIDIELDAEAIQLQEYVITASRGRREKLTDALAAITVITASEIRRKTNPNLGDYFKNIKGVDFTASGIDGFNLSARGFNTSFSSRLLTLTDGRKANVPSLRLIAYNTIPTTSDDVDQIEVVLGPSSALYGPNAFAGVANIITKKPSLSLGTIASVTGGNRDYRKWQVRHAGSNGRFGYKVSMADFSALDWKWIDPEEKRSHHKYFIEGGEEDDLPYPWIWDGYDMRFDRNGNGRYDDLKDSVSYGIDQIDPDLNNDGLNDLPEFRVENQRVDIRMDYDFSSDHGLVYSYGLARATNINITGVARFLADRWIYQYHQVRYFKGNFFIQTYINTSNAGNTRNLRTGDVIIDESKFNHIQAQHTLNLPKLLSTTLTYGFDYQRTMPKTFGTILPDGKNGKSFDKDGIDNDEDGQVDEFAEGLIVTNEYGFYFQSASTLMKNLQLILAMRLDLHNGVTDPTSGFTFLDDPLQGTTVKYDPQISPKVGLMWKPTENQTIRLTAARAFNTPTSQGLYLDLLVGQVVPFFVKARGNANGYHYSRTAAGNLLMFDVTAGSSTEFFLAELPPDAVLFIPAVLGRPSQFIDPANITDIAAIKSEEMFTAEVGYIGLLGNRMRVTLDIYRSWYENFVSDLTWITPVVLDTSDGLDNASVIGIIFTEEHNGVNPGDDGLYETPDDNSRDFDAPPQLLLTNINYGEVSLGGVDFSLDYFFSPRLTAGVRFSWLGEQAFHNPLTNADDPVNAPVYKVSANVNYQPSDGTWWSGLSVRHIPEFKWSAGVFFGTIDTYTVADLTLGYKLSSVYTAKLNVNNLTNDVHREIVGGAEIGRMVTVTLTMSL